MRQTSANSDADVTTEPHDSRIWPTSSHDQQSLAAEAPRPGFVYQEAEPLSCDLTIKSDRSDRPSTYPIAQASPIADFSGSLQSLPPLGSALGDFRALLTRSWTADTALPGALTFSESIPGRPHGQCGVSSLWLSQILDREYSICSMLCRGDVYFGVQRTDRLSNHCWLEIDGGSGEAVILDLTCDQAGAFRREIVFNSRTQLDRERVHYILSEKIDVSNVFEHLDLWRRYRRLLVNMLALTLPRFSVWLPLIAILQESAEKLHGSVTKD
jgi:hypothetical protein